MALASLIVAIVAALLAAASAVYTRHQAIANADMTAIEKRRLHAELTPQLNLYCAVPSGASNVAAILSVELAGPPGLGGLDEVTVRIRDDRPGRQPEPGSDLTQEQISATIWGPYRIDPRTDDADPSGRFCGPFQLSKNEPRRIVLAETTAPPRYRFDWRSDWAGKRVRVEITCRDKEESWVVLRELEPERLSGRHI